MEIVRGKSSEVNFEDLDEGETFSEPDNDQVQIKTDDSSGCCLSDGELTSYSDEKVVRVACEVRML